MASLFGDQTTSQQTAADPFAGMDEKQLKQLLAALTQLLQQSGTGGTGMNPLGSAQQQIAAMHALAGRPSTGYVDNPLAGSVMMQGATPSTAGPVQWLGGMPPGYNDSVAKKLAIGANIGNLGGYDLLGGLLKGLMGRLGGGQG